jgi:thiamine kinase-like enzyme
MNQAVDVGNAAVGTADLRDALVQTLSGHFGKHCGVIGLERRPFTYTTSFAIEELDVQLDDGTSLVMLFKDLSRHALVADARQAKPAFLYNPLREIETYRKILAPLRLGTANCYGSIIQPERGRYWLFLEKVLGIELYQEGAVAVWQQVAAWLAGLHARFDGQAELLLPAVPLLVYDRNYYRQWLSRAQSIVGKLPDGANNATRALAELATGYDRIIDRLMALPTTLLHGEFYASNVLVEKTGNDLRVCPVDWEMAAVGPGLIDLAALSAGKWSESSKEAMARAYCAALTQSGISVLPWDELLVALNCCRLHQAVQWLGWSSTWSPPPAQTQDWLGEALRLAEKIAG